MNITPLNFDFISFASRKKEIREADAVERKTKLTFPAISATYIDDFYYSAKPNSKNRFRTEYISDKIQAKIEETREIAKNPDFYIPDTSEIEKSTLYAINLNRLKKSKIGNCKENAMAAVAVLAANGYYNSKRVELNYKMDLTDRITGKKYTKFYPLDHSFAVTDMIKENSLNNGERNIVIDPWLGFAESKEGAIGRFKQIYDKKDYDEAKNTLTSLFCRDKKITKAQLQDNFEIKEGFEFFDPEPYTTDYQMKRLGEYSRAMFDTVI